MNWARKFVFATLSLMLLSTAGCDLFPKKKTTAGVTPNHGAPTISPPLPDQIPEKQAEPIPTPVAKHEPNPVPPPPPPKKRHQSNVAKKTTPAASSASPASAQGNAPAQSNASTQNNASAQSNAPAGTTTVAVNRPPEEPPTHTAIATEVAPAQASVDKQSTSQMLDEAEKTVKALDDHSLSGDQKAMVSQILSYIAQSKKATIDGDLERALNLAKKAQLLSQALVNK